jgi:DNA polymerase III subunit delta'
LKSRLQSINRVIQSSNYMNWLAQVTDFVALDHSDLGLEADRLGDHPHPREMLWYGGDETIELALLNAYRSGKLHHAWLISGAEGIGKATLAYRFARFLFANPDPASATVQQAVNLAVAVGHPVTGQVARLSHPDLAVIRRGLTKDGKSLRAEIAVDDVRDGLSIFKVTAGAGGWRVVIVDAADDLNRASANALLKMLEEPPQKAIFILIAQKPGSLLPTIRSRCRVLRVPSLEPSVIVDGIKRLTDGTGPQMAEVAQLAGGSLRQALALLDPATATLRREARRLLDGAHQREGKAVMALLDKTTGKPGVIAFHILIEMIEQHLRSIVLGGKNSGGNSAMLAASAELWEKLRTAARDVETYNLDRRPFLLSIFAQLADIERRA